MSTHVRSFIYMACDPATVVIRSSSSCNMVAQTCDIVYLDHASVVTIIIYGRHVQRCIEVYLCTNSTIEFFEKYCFWTTSHFKITVNISLIFVGN